MKHVLRIMLVVAGVIITQQALAMNQTSVSSALKHQTVNTDDALTQKIKRILTPAFKEALLVVLREGNDDGTLVKKIIEDGHLNPNDLSSGYTPLMWALNNGKFKMADCLIESKADVDMPQDASQRTLLHIASSSQNEKSCFIMRWLIAHKANVDAKDGYGRTALLLSLETGQHNKVSYLLRHKADVDSTDVQGLTALHYAIKNSDVASAEFLIARQADLNMHGKGKTPLHQAVATGNIDCIKLLLEAKANPNFFDDSYHTPLHYAVVSKKPNAFNVVACMLRCNAEVNSNNSLGQTPLMLAVYHAGDNDKEHLIKFLLEEKAHINKQDVPSGDSALHTAYSLGQDRIISLLIDCGADTNLLSRDGKKPAELKR